MSEIIDNNVGVVILAAGQGKRLNCTEIPKVMHPIGGKPIVSYIVENLEAGGLCKENICLVVGFKKEKVIGHFGERVAYAEQTELLGTAHAAYTGMRALPEHVEHVLVINGDDSAFYSDKTLSDFVRNHISSGAVLSLLSVVLDDPALYGRIVRNGESAQIVEKEYLTDEQKQVNETSTGTFCFNREWFEQIFPEMPRMRKLGEFGLPAALAMANDRDLPVRIVTLENRDEWFGINTPAELEEADKRKR